MCCAVKRETCWHGATAHWIRTQRGLFLGMFRCLGPRQKALIKRSSLGGWKLGYQLHCRSSMGPTRLHLVNTFLPSLAQIRPRLPKATRGLTEHFKYNSFHHVFSYTSIQFHTKLNSFMIFFVILSSKKRSPQPIPSPVYLPFLICFTLLINSESRGVSCFDHIMRMPRVDLMGFQRKAELKSLHLFRCAHSV